MKENKMQINKRSANVQAPGWSWYPFSFIYSIVFNDKIL